MQVTATEVAERSLTPHNYETALMQLKVSGYTVLENMIEPAKIEVLRSRFLELLDEYSSRHAPNRGPNRYGILLPFEAPFNDPELVANPIVSSLLAPIIGEDFVCSFYSSDNALPGSEYQQAHSDVDPLFPERDLATPPYAVMVNIHIVDSTEENGPAEMWPYGTHLIGDTDLIPRHNKFQDIEERRNSPLGKFSESLQPVPLIAPAGSISIRDLRMWHRGTPNRTTEPRPMLSMICNRPWYLHDLENRNQISRDVYEAAPSEVQRIFRPAVLIG
jgi:ectoine hydroxylase-related dioxygenase (phytanoyl-CoA dioxygenase family)